MRKRRTLSGWPIWFTALAVLLMGLPLTGTSSSPQRPCNENPPPFDFSDAFYTVNGINPANIRERAGNPDRNPTHWTVDNSNTDPNRRNIRILETTGGFNNAGSLIYYSIMGTVFNGGVDANGNPLPQTFQRDANGNLTPAGQQALNIANHFRAFLFPKTTRDTNNNPIFVKSPAPPNRRQDNVFDTRDGYFSNNPLGLWILAFVVYTANAFTPEGRAVLDPIAATNGRDLDGTPILTTADLIDGLAAQGLVQIVTRNTNGSEGFPWVI